MRIEKSKIDFLKQEIRKYLPDSRIYLFGSRVDDKKKGGDIDLLILSNSLLKQKNKRDIKIAFYKNFGEQKIDLVYFQPNEINSFKELALMEGVEL